MSSSSSSMPSSEDSQSQPAWKAEVNQRLEAHRGRRARRTDDYPRLPLEGVEPEDSGSRSKASSVAQRVAARYAKAPTYSEMLAEEARNAARAAETAARAAQDAHAAAQAILEGLDISPATEPEPMEPAPTFVSEPVSAPGSAPREEPPPVRARAVFPSRITEAVSGDHARVQPAHRAPMEISIVDPFEEATVTPVQPLPANLIEFPRELIAARKARPRLAEGPLRDEEGGEAAGERAQLRIFEVEPETISQEPVKAEESVLPEWSSIRLDARPERLHEHHEEPPAHLPRHLGLDLPLKTASLEDRLMAAVVDGALTVAGFLVFVLVFVACTTHPPTGKPALMGAAAALFGIALLYQWLFFTWAEGTPGMRYAKIALCTFDDDNPTRKQMRRRLGALLLSVCPVGLGCAWALFDEDRLGWHDRLSQTYQRSYR